MSGRWHQSNWESGEYYALEIRISSYLRAGAYGAAGTAMAVPLFWSHRTILRVKIEKMECMGGLRHANFSLARGRKEIRTLKLLKIRSSF